MTEPLSPTSRLRREWRVAAADLDDLDLFTPTTEPNPAATPRKCRRHSWSQTDPAECLFCAKRKDGAASRRGRNNKKRGTSDEPRVAAILGGRAIGPLGLPHDVEVGDYLHAQAKKLDRWPSMNEIVRWIEAIAPGQWMRAVTLADTPGAGRRTSRYIVIPLDEFARWHGAAS